MKKRRVEVQVQGGFSTLPIQLYAYLLSFLPIEQMKVMRLVNKNSKLAVGTLFEKYTLTPACPALSYRAYHKEQKLLDGMIRSLLSTFALSNEADVDYTPARVALNTMAEFGFNLIDVFDRLFHDDEYIDSQLAYLLPSHTNTAAYSISAIKDHLTYILFSFITDIEENDFRAINKLALIEPKAYTKMLCSAFDEDAIYTLTLESYLERFCRSGDNFFFSTILHYGLMTAFIHLDYNREICLLPSSPRRDYYSVNCYQHIVCLDLYSHHLKYGNLTAFDKQRPLFLEFARVYRELNGKPLFESLRDSLAELHRYINDQNVIENLTEIDSEYVASLEQDLEIEGDLNLTQPDSSRP